MHSVLLLLVILSTYISHLHNENELVGVYGGSAVCLWLGRNAVFK